MKEFHAGVREDTIRTINDFVKIGLPPGSFVQAVLENNLMESFGRADMGNRMALFEICEYVYNDIPSACHGSREKVKDWIERGGLEGIQSKGEK